MLRGLPEQWCRLTDEHQRRLFEEELAKELGPVHSLVGLPVTVIAKRDDRDDVLVMLGGGRVAEVHLTWSGKGEADPRWPRTVIFESMEEWHAQQV